MIRSPSRFWTRESDSDFVRDVSTKKVARRPVADRLRCQFAETHHVLKVSDRNVSKTQYFSQLSRNVATTLMPLIKSTGWHKRVFFLVFNRAFKARAQAQKGEYSGSVWALPWLWLWLWLCAGQSSRVPLTANSDNKLQKRNSQLAS